MWKESEKAGGHENRLPVRVRRLPTYKQEVDLMQERVDGKPTVREIAEASKHGYRIKYEIITCQGVEILITRDKLYHAIETTAEFTHDPRVEELAKRLGIKLRRFKHSERTHSR